MHLSDWVRQQANELSERQLWRTLVPVDGNRSGELHGADGGSILCFSSNDYLSLSSHPTLAQAVSDAAHRYGTSTASSRLLAGTASHHLEAEAALANFVQQPAAVLFSSGYAANTGTIPAVLSGEDLIVSDQFNHASIIDGCRLSRATVKRFPHRDVTTARKLLADHRASHRHALLVTDALFSMDADVADLPSLRRIADEFDAWLYVDEAHSLGVLGPQGRGLAPAQETVPDIVVGTLGKAFGLTGAFVAGSDTFIKFLHNRARSFMYSTAVPPMLSHGVLAAIPIVEKATDRRARLIQNTRRVRTALTEAGHTTLNGPGPIVPWILKSPQTTISVANALHELGLFTQPVRPPTVPVGTSRLRLVPTAGHRDQDIDRLVDAIRNTKPLHA